MSIEENSYGKLSATELSAIILKGSPISNDRDIGFCSGSSEDSDDLSMDHTRMEPRSPTDASEDSVEVKVTPICFTRNKRKSTEPSRVICEQEVGPLKKRIRYSSENNNNITENFNCNDNNNVNNNNNTDISPDVDMKNHFRPWDQSALEHELMPHPAEILIRHPGLTTLHRPAVDYSDVQEEPLALVTKKTSSSPVCSPPSPQSLSSLNLSSESLATKVVATSIAPPVTSAVTVTKQSQPLLLHKENSNAKISLDSQQSISNSGTNDSKRKTLKNGDLSRTKISSISSNCSVSSNGSENDNIPLTVHSNRIPLIPLTSPSSSSVPTVKKSNTLDSNNSSHNNDNISGSRIRSSSSSSSVSSSNNNHSNSGTNSINQRPQQRNYKNMTRERRIEANARERTRVHTISAAYDTLRKAIPSYSHTQKLSKLSVLRVACSYILTLSRMAGEDYSEDQSAPSLAQCFEMVTKTIQTEGKIRKKKDEP